MFWGVEGKRGVFVGEGGTPSGNRLTHLDGGGRAWMVDVGEKPETHRVAVARGEVRMKPGTIRLIKEGAAAKGDVLGVARVAGIMAAKQVGQLIPLCHPIPITRAAVYFRIHDEGKVEIEARVETIGRTGVEMEAMTAVTVTALTIYDMVKAVDRGITIENIRLVEKAGGKSGRYYREGEEQWNDTQRA